MLDLRWTLPVLVAATLTAGCMDPGEDLGGDATILAYDGEESGDHEKRAECDGNGNIQGNGNIEDGKVKLVIKDGEGNEVYSKTYDAEFTLDSAGLSGRAGNWTLRAERTGDDLAGDPFNGRYTFTMAC